MFNPMWLVVLLSAAMFASLDVLNKVFVGKESFWAMIFYTAFFTTCIVAYPALSAWVPPTVMQYGLMACLGAGANALLYCLLKSFSMVDASALAPFRYTELILSATVGFLLSSAKSPRPRRSSVRSSSCPARCTSCGRRTKRVRIERRRPPYA